MVSRNLRDSRKPIEAEVAKGKWWDGAARRESKTCVIPRLAKRAEGPHTRREADARIASRSTKGSRSTWSPLIWVIQEQLWGPSPSARLRMTIEGVARFNHICNQGAVRYSHLRDQRPFADAAARRPYQ